MKFKSLMTAGCLLAAATSVHAQPFAYVANSGTKNVSVIDTGLPTPAVTATVALTDGYPATPHPYAKAVAVSKSGQYVYVAVEDSNEVQVIDAATNTVITSKTCNLSNHTVKPGGLAVNAAETRLFVTSYFASNLLYVYDISGNTCNYMAQVDVDTATMSGPEGVIISPDGNKAYVANAATGNIAEISQIESAGISRTQLIPTGTTWIRDLALSSDGKKLYASSGAGSQVVVMDTSTYNVALLTVASGNNSVSIAPDNSKVYAPADTAKTLYVIDATANPNIVSDAYLLSGMPSASAITPDGTKLYIAMDDGNNSYSVRVFDTVGKTITNTIPLPSGANPLAIGNFMGPDLPYTINATNGLNCTISPVGNVLVNKLGRTFTSTGAGSTVCEIKVDGATQGQPSSYTFSNLTAGHTIDSSPITGTFYTLSGDWISSIGGWVKSSPAGIDQSSKSAKFIAAPAAGSTVVLSVGDSTNHQIQSGSWTGDCAGSGATCTLVMNGDKTFGVTVVAAGGMLTSGPFYNVTKSAYYASWAECIAAASANDYIKATTAAASVTTTGTVTPIKLSSQWKSTDASTKDNPYKSLPLIISNVAIIAGSGSDALIL